MKTLILFFALLSSAFASAQRVALIDKEFKRPVLYTDSVTISQISDGYIAIDTRSFDTLVTNLKFIKEYISNFTKRSKMKRFTLKSLNTSINVTSESHAYGDVYDIVLSTDMGYMVSTFQIADHRKLNKKTGKLIKSFIEYLKNESSYFSPNYVEKTPTFYSVEVYQ